MSDFHIEHLPIADLKPNARNARRHPKKQLHQIAASIRELAPTALSSLTGRRYPGGPWPLKRPSWLV
jgi:hypothetical protein